MFFYMFFCQIVLKSPQSLALPASTFGSIVGKRGKILEFCQKHMKVHKICFKISSSHFFDLRRPPITLTGFSFLYLDKTSKVIFSNSLKWKKLDPRSLFGPKNLLRIGKKYVSNFYGSRFFIFQFFSKWRPFSG